MKTMTMVMLLVFMTSCSNFQSVDSMTNDDTPVRTAQNTNAPALNRLEKVYANYKGSPYRYGGTDRSGFDCTGFIGVAFSDAFNMSTPRTTEKISISGKPVRRDQLQAGDILIFKTSVKQLHAGIYTSDGQFIHASTSQGVIKSNLNNPYWHQRYVKARRLLN
ncbi:C40 family peptidase [Reinekea sp. G2M2-21]|uniref:C40 family peptidase n=1 Tax=Reinekea sp. G2M2-21 TaxID=2788942 RepID=UPI001E336B4D|nr:NlpC/P60 family protein [Reinekea sp. G2M2-21]